MQLWFQIVPPHGSYAVLLWESSTGVERERKSSLGVELWEITLRLSAYCGHSILEAKERVMWLLR